MEITTNNVPRELVALVDVPAEERSDFDYIDEDDAYSPRLFRYKDSWYDSGEFCAITPASELTANPYIHRVSEDSPLLAWHGIQTDSFFSAVVLRYADDQCENIIVGRVLL